MRIYRCIDCMPVKPCKFITPDGEAPTHCPIDNRCEVNWIKEIAKEPGVQADGLDGGANPHCDACGGPCECGILKC